MLIPTPKDNVFISLTPISNPLAAQMGLTTYVGKLINNGNTVVQGRVTAKSLLGATKLFTENYLK